MSKFYKEFKTLNFVIKKSPSILLFAHSRPDGDTIGSALALREYIKSLHKKVDIACFDPFPDYLKSLSPNFFNFPSHLDIKKYKLIIASDSVERGFDKIRHQISSQQIVALIDHHPDITLHYDINIIDANYSSACEIIYNFFEVNKVEITRSIATFILLGILGDTGMFQHSNTTPRVLEIASNLMRKGAPMTKIAQAIFTHKNISTLKLWGKAFEKAKINPENGMIVSALTKEEMKECGAGVEDVAQVAGILNTVPGTKFSLVLSERNDGIVKGSLRSEEYKGADVSKIASQFGGGGHKLASGFEVKGKLVEIENGWKIV